MSERRSKHLSLRNLLRPAGDAVPAGQPPTEAELRKLVEPRLSRQMIRERIHIVAELPRTWPGKADRDRLQWQAEAGTPRI